MEQTTIGQRIRQKRRALKLTQKDLARKLKDVSHVAVSQWESNTTKPNAENLYELSVLFGCDFSWLLKGEGTNVDVVEIDNARIPIIDYEQLKKWNGKQPFKISIEKEVEYIMTNTNISRNTFAFKVIGDSMEPNFIEGDIIVIDPTLKPSPGEFVLAKNSDEVFFRKYKENFKEEGIENFSLLPLNENYASISSQSHNVEIIGTMIEHRIFRRKR
ncbi:MAG: S24 family peptidase [Neisseria sp.]|uniref:LexA family protein n=1 Tax=Neisseria sp. TaxID=192066 RepID=UPI0026DBA274|nr:S24 family peptidase [Neisseria sp.]MDO4641690.1 S24 family peptidase [Neisseria sp.]